MAGRDAAELLPIDQRATWTAGTRAIGRAMKVRDAWIAATATAIAIAHSAAVCAQDADFDAAQHARLVEVAHAQRPPSYRPTAAATRAVRPT